MVAVMRSATVAPVSAWSAETGPHERFSDDRRTDTTGYPGEAGTAPGRAPGRAGSNAPARTCAGIRDPEAERPLGPRTSGIAGESGESAGLRRRVRRGALGRPVSRPSQRRGRFLGRPRDGARPGSAGGFLGPAGEHLGAPLRRCGTVASETGAGLMHWSGSTLLVPSPGTGRRSLYTGSPQAANRLEVNMLGHKPRRS